jgi:cell filamentation protein, protein adenylyltransferase
MGATSQRLLDHLFWQPVITVNAARDHLGLSYVAANALIKELTGLGVLNETTGGSRNRIFRFGPYVDLFQDVTEEPAEISEAQHTRY